MQTPASTAKKWRWYHGVLFYAGIGAATYALAEIVKLTRATAPAETVEQFYNKQIQPVFAPPAWAFGPAWTINNVLCIYALLRVLNMPREKKWRAEFLTLQAVSWLDFVAFSAAAFSLRSNFNSAVLTNFYLLLTVASIYVALVRLRDAPTALSLSTLTLWLAIASPLSLTMAAWNGDEFYKVKPLAEAPPAWVKQSAAQ